MRITKPIVKCIPDNRKALDYFEQHAADGGTERERSIIADFPTIYIHNLNADRVKRVYNARGNPQKDYYPAGELDTIFNKIWSELRRYDGTLFPTVSKIRDSAVFKASPLHKLTSDQEHAKELILEKVHEALRRNKTHQLIFISGEAGTGKTVLNSSTFYEL